MTCLSAFPPGRLAKTRSPHHFGIDRKTIRAWRTRAREAGAPGLVPRYPKRRRRRISGEVIELIAHARRELQYGACRTRIWLMRVHPVKVATATFSRIYTDLGLPRLQCTKRRRAGRQLKVFEKGTPGKSVQLDVKVVKIAGTKSSASQASPDPIEQSSEEMLL